MKLTMKPLKKYIEPELDIFRSKCNFTEEELVYFNMKSKDSSDIKISYHMNISCSKVAKLSKLVRDKMENVIALDIDIESYNVNND